MPRSRVHRIEHARRAAAVLERVNAAVPMAKIADELDLHKSTVYRLFQFALRETMQPAADEYRQVTRQRLEALLAACWPKALKGDNWSIDRARMLIKDIRELDGQDAPIKAHITVSDEMTDEIRRLAAELGVEDPDHVPLDDRL